MSVPQLGHSPASQGMHPGLRGGRQRYSESRSLDTEQ